MHFALLSAAMAFSAMVSAIRINEPKNTTVWTATGPGAIEWESVSTDQQTFILKIVSPGNPVEGDVIAESIETSAGSYTWTPAHTLAAGQYRINAVSADPKNPGILAQSEYFSVGGGSGNSAVGGSNSGTDSTDSTGSAGLTVHSAKPTQATPAAAEQTPNQNPASPPNAATPSSSPAAAQPDAAPPADASAANAESTPAASSGAGQLVVSTGLLAIGFATVGAMI